MDKGRKRSLTRRKSPAVRKTTAGKSPARARSKSRGKQVGKEARARARSKSTSKREPRSRSKPPAKSKSPGRRTRSRSRRSTSRTRRESSRSRRSEISSLPASKMNSVSGGTGDASGQKKLSLVLKDIYHDDYVRDSDYSDMIRRSISKESSHDHHSSVSRRYNASEPKELDNFGKETIAAATVAPSATAASVKATVLPTMSRKYSIGIPSWVKATTTLLFLPPLVLLIHLACTKEQCTLSKFHIHKNIRFYLNLQSAEIFAGFVAVQTVLSLLGVGRKVGGPPGINGTLMYRCNGLLSTFLSVGIVAALWHYKYPVTIVCERMISLIVSSTIFGFLLGIVLFIKGGRAAVPSLNPSVVAHNKLYQFVFGRETNPFLFGKINVKTLLLRISFNGLVLINGLLMLKAYETKHELSSSLIACVALSTFLILEFYFFEDSFPSTFEAMYEGTGCYLALSYLLFPFFPALVTKYIIQHKVNVPIYGLAAVVTFFFIGFYIYRASNLEKAAFRRNPLNPALAYFETISTSRGKKLLVSGWWGFVRHPNYLGTIILYWAWASTAGYTHAIPYVFPLLMTLSLISRARRVDSHCRERYLTSWDQYCGRVPHRIIPRVF